MTEPFSFWTYRRPFTVDGAPALVTVRSTMSGLYSSLILGDRIVASDHTPAAGPESVRNHQLSTILADGRRLDVEAGYISWVNVGIAARLNGAEIHRSHPGRLIRMPDGAAKMMASKDMTGYDPTAFSRNKVPLMVDIGLGLLFFLVAKLTDLPTAAIIGAGAGLALIVVDRFVKVDLIGGLALFGVVMLLASAALAILFQDDLAVKLRSTILGIATAVCFLTDGLFGGRWLGKGLSRYLPYADIQPGRLAIGMGVLGLVMAGLNTAVAYGASTDVWLFYSTFVDFILVMLMVLLVFRFARGQPLFGSKSA